jgi:hypothetical protein
MLAAALSPPPEGSALAELCRTACALAAAPAAAAPAAAPVLPPVAIPDLLI